VEGGKGRTEREFFRTLGQADADGVLTDVLFVLRVIMDVPDSVINVSTLPDFSSHLQKFASAVRESALNELHRAFKSATAPCCEKNVHVIWHDYEFVQEIFSLAAIFEQGVDEKRGHSF
jgi:hypothetical protein